MGNGRYLHRSVFYFIKTDCILKILTNSLCFELGDTGSGISRDEFIDNVAADILAKMPKTFEVWRIKKSLQMSLTPTGVVLLQELDRYNALVEMIAQTLGLLRKAIAGEIGMDVTLDNIATSLFNGQLPMAWRKLAPATCKQLGGWMDHLKVIILFKWRLLN